MKRINLQKAKSQIARPTTIRDINKRIVLNYVRDRAPISRAEIARETELHRSTVSVIIDELLESGLIVEIGSGVSTGGRRPTLFDLKKDVPCAIGIDLGPRTSTIALADLAGSILEKESFSTSPDVEFMTTQIVDRVGRIADRFPGQGLEIGMSVPGLVDQKLGKVFHVPYFNWHDWDICEKVRQRTGMTVIVENDANATALAELWFGHEKIRKTDTFVMVLVGEGIGTGIIFDGQVYRGEMGAGGEFGHMILGTDAPVDCSCGSRECWEAYASEPAIVERYKRRLKDDAMKQNDTNVSDIIELAQHGERHAVDAMRETVHYLGNGISNLIVGLSPQVVVVSGRMTAAWDLMADDLHRVMERSVLAGLPQTELMPSSLGDSPTLTGAVGLVLARKFGAVN
ncbi:MAG TPA: ROK family transcriptional regulator [Pyrinomonadaceae bacterium]|nr:ROK family transcriptional regulator [Pyrinomonadaceae bacterium]HMP66879.1 ROK family transcriptional regulator [Pyrinomonadaceae bacterium]